MRIKAILLSLFILPSVYIQAQPNQQKKEIIENLDAKSDHFGTLAHQIWDLAELGFLENESVALLTGELTRAGFSIQMGVAGMPTAFIASYGNSGPVIGLLAEYDALPGMSQAAIPERQPREEGKAGHACGHHLFGSASTAAAIAVKEWLERTGNPGTIRLYGTPAEEGGGGKIFMVRSGLFDDVDAVLTWHPGSANASSPKSTLSAISVNFTFHGVSSHAARFPERGRSALDGVEAMNDMVNLMREHIPEKSRIHYSISQGGGAPNVVPDIAAASYVIRHPDMPAVKDLVRRVTLAAEGAAMGTETTVEREIETGYYNVLPNAPLAKVMHDNLSIVGGVTYTPVERAFAVKIIESFSVSGYTPEAASRVEPYNEAPALISASTDVGDISWVVPTMSLSAATWVPGTSSHSWQAVAAGGMSIGIKGMMVAAKTIALSATDLFTQPALLLEAKRTLMLNRGPAFEYEALLGDREPPLNYRVGY